MFRLLSAFAFSSFLFLGACTAPEESTPAVGAIRIEATLDAAVVGSAVLEIELYTEQDAGLENATLTAVPYMPMMEHGSELTAEIIEIGDGFYEASPIGFSMPGMWEVTVSVKETDHYESAERVFSYDVQ